MVSPKAYQALLEMNIITCGLNYITNLCSIIANEIC